MEQDHRISGSGDVQARQSHLPIVEDRADEPVSLCYFAVIFESDVKIWAWLEETGRQLA